jgi:type IV pilus assembly protein PilN
MPICRTDKTRSALLTRKEIIEQLQSNRSQMVHLFDEMVKTIPDGARLASMKQAGEVLTLEGIAESNSRVASYMRNIDVSPWMGRTDLRKIENKSAAKDVDKKLPYAFSLDVKLRKPQSDKDAADAADAKDGSLKEGAVPGAKKPGLGVQLDDAAIKLTAKPTAVTDKPAAAADNAPAAPATPSKTPATGEKK